jgi:hypothetical protein
LVAPENRIGNKLKFLKLLDLTLDRANPHFIRSRGIAREDAGITKLRNNQHLGRIIAADLLESGGEIFLTAASRSEICVHDDEVHIIGGFCFRIRAEGNVVVYIADKAPGIKFVNPVAHLIALCAAALRGGLTFVADAPGKDAGMILVLLDHFPEHLLGERNHLGIPHLLLGELPSGFLESGEFHAGRRSREYVHTLALSILRPTVTVVTSR